ncbi:MAG: helix-turn-helix transcriptional regulator [Chloroflexi bacterium]|nr:helix-turn-helix transcriptional regulator [Chloroflexota bacterium]
MVAKRDSTAFDLLGKRWSALIVKDLIQGPRRFRELLHSLGRINDKVLSQRLKELEARGIIRRQVFAEVPVRVEYSLTDKGRALAGVIHEMEQWDEAHSDHIARSGNGAKAHESEPVAMAVGYAALPSAEVQATGIAPGPAAMTGSSHAHAAPPISIAAERRTHAPVSGTANGPGASHAHPPPKISFWKRLGL